MNLECCQLRDIANSPRAIQVEEFRIIEKRSRQEANEWAAKLTAEMDRLKKLRRAKKYALDKSRNKSQAG
jgi:hypothetical protein